MNNALLMDIGGTNIRYAYIENSNIKEIIKEPFQEDNFEAYLTNLINKKFKKTKIIAIAAAGPKINNKIELTNRNLVIDAQSISKNFNLEACYLMNDWEAIGFSLKELPSSELIILKKEGNNLKNSLLIGPGTGLGLTMIINGEIIPTEIGNIVSATEGALKNFSLNKDKDFIVLEDILSGPGIKKIYEKKFGKELSSEKIIEQAKLGDEKARFVIDGFLKTLAQIICDICLSFSIGKIFFAGAILNSLEDFLAEIDLLNNAKEKEINSKYFPLIGETGITLITTEEPAIYGCIGYIKEKAG